MASSSWWLRFRFSRPPKWPPLWWSIGGRSRRNDDAVRLGSTSREPRMPQHRPRPQTTAAETEEDVIKEDSGPPSPAPPTPQPAPGPDYKPCLLYTSPSPRDRQKS